MITRDIMAIVAGYVAASALVVGMYQAWEGNPFTAHALSAGLMLTTYLSLPGFIVLRTTLWALRQTGPVAFALAGTVNSSIALSLFFRRVVVFEFPIGIPLFGLFGVAAGSLYWWVERRIAGRTLVRGAGKGLMR